MMSLSRKRKRSSSIRLPRRSTIPIIPLTSAGSSRLGCRLRSVSCLSPMPTPARIASGLSARGQLRAVRLMPTKNDAGKTVDDLRPEYDLSKLKGGVRGKYYERASAGTTFVLLEPDVAEAFPDGRTVNQALRALIKVAESRVPTTRGERANRPLQPTSRAKRKAKSKQR